MQRSASMVEKSSEREVRRPRTSNADMSRHNNKNKNKNQQKPSSSALASTPELGLPLITTTSQAFAAVRAEIEAIPAEQLTRINVDVARATRRGLVTARNVQPLLPALAELRPFDVRPVRMLRLYSLALSHAHSLAIEAGSELPPLPVLVAEAMPLRERLLRNAELLAHYGFVSEERVAAIRRGHGHVDLADALMALGRLFDEVWSRVHNRIMASREEVERSVTLSVELQDAIALHEARQAPLTQHDGRRFVRAQAFTLFYRAYQQTRRGVLFLRWDEGDARKLVPSLHARRFRSPGSEDETATDERLDPGSVTEDDPPTPEPTPPSSTAATDLVASA
jgi:hypothetical protein